MDPLHSPVDKVSTDVVVTSTPALSDVVSTTLSNTIGPTSTADTVKAPEEASAGSCLKLCEGLTNFLKGAVGVFGVLIGGASKLATLALGLGAILTAAVTGTALGLTIGIVGAIVGGFLGAFAGHPLECAGMGLKAGFQAGGVVGLAVLAAAVGLPLLATAGIELAGSKMMEVPGWKDTNTANSFLEHFYNQYQGFANMDRMPQNW